MLKNKSFITDFINFFEKEFNIEFLGADEKSQMTSAPLDFIISYFYGNKNNRFNSP